MQQKGFYRILFFCLISTPLLVTLNCSILSSKSDRNFEKFESPELKKYKEALSLQTTDPRQSCLLFLELAEKNFALKNLALLRSHLICEPSALNTQSVNWAQLLQTEPWLESLDIERQISESRKQQNVKSLAESLLRKAHWLQNNSDRANKKNEITELLLAAAEQIQHTVSGDIGPLNEENSKLQKSILDSLYQISPRFNPNPSPNQALTVAQDWIYVRQYEKGRNILNSILANSNHTAEEKYVVQKALRTSYKTEQDKQGFIDACQKMILYLNTQAESPSRRLEAYITLARAQWTEGQISAANKTLDEAEKILSGKTSLAELHFVRGKMAEEDKKIDLAITHLQKAQKESLASGILREKILFSLAWIDRKSEKFKEAADLFSDLKQNTKDPFDKNRYWFWYTKSLAQANPEQKTYLDEYKQLIANDPLGYYGILARKEINESFPPINQNKKISNQQNKVFSSTENELAQSLAYSQENEVLLSFLDHKSKALREQQNTDNNSWLELGQWYAKSGLYQPLFQLIGALDSKAKLELFETDPELLFPRKYNDIVELAGKKLNVEKAFIFSIIRQESSFNPKARSSVNAFGLMQLMPKIAQELVNKNNINEILKSENIAPANNKELTSNPETLYQEKLNIFLGTALLAELNQKFKGQFIPKVAAYNANEKAIHNWMKNRWRQDPIEFIEEIPYEETRSYIKLVMRNYIFYSRLEDPAQPLSFPMTNERLATAE